MRTAAARLLSDETGEDLIEYGLLAAFASTIATAVIIGDPFAIRTSLVTIFNKAKAALDNS